MTWTTMTTVTKRDVVASGLTAVVLGILAIFLFSGATSPLLLLGAVFVAAAAVFSAVRTLTALRRRE